MSVSPLVTFVVPCYKLAHLLPQCVNSILGQDFQDFEILIMDNCSPDDTPLVAQSFKDPRVKHIRSESNLGHVRNFNKGLTLASGKYVWLVSADDMLRSPRSLGRYVEAMERDPRVGFVYCRAVELREGKEAGIAQWTDSGDQDRIRDDTSFFIRLIEFNCISMSSVMIRKQCLEKTSLFPLDLLFASDWHLWCMLALYFPVAYFAEPMVCCRFHEESLTSLYYQDHARICIGDELTVLWRVGRQAELAGMLTQRDACDKALVTRAVRRLEAGMKGDVPCMSEAEFEEILQNRIPDVNSIREIRAAVYTSLADQLYSGGQYPQAAQSYRLGLSARPGRLKTWAKYLLLHTGALGIRIRQLAD